jgi:hypothetical protein
VGAVYCVLVPTSGRQLLGGEGKVAKARLPLDRRPYTCDPRSCPIRVGLANGTYVYVQDAAGIVRVLPDGSHLHPRVLGGTKAALYAGDLTLASDSVVDLTNLSGSFQFNEPEGLLAVAHNLAELGLKIGPRAIRFFPTDGSAPYILKDVP